MDYHGPLRITRNPDLSETEGEVEARFAGLIQSSLDAMIAEYLTRFGPIIDTDRARELCPDYAANPKSRSQFARAVYRPAKALADEIYRREVYRVQLWRRQRILFTSGGAGAGKSTALLALQSTMHPSEQHDVLVDGTLSDYDSAREKIYGALSFSHGVSILHVHRNFRDSVRAVVRRAIRQGRVVTLHKIAFTHFHAKETLMSLERDFGENINIRAVFCEENQEARTASWGMLSEEDTPGVDSLLEAAHRLLAHEFSDLEVNSPEIFEALRHEGRSK